MAYYYDGGIGNANRRKQPVVQTNKTQNENEQSDEYDDGFDDMSEEEEQYPLSRKEKEDIRKNRFLMATGAGNLLAVITGTIAILILLALLFSMIGFVLNDVERNFTLFQTRL